MRARRAELKKTKAKRMEGRWKRRGRHTESDLVCYYNADLGVYLMAVVGLMTNEQMTIGRMTNDG